MMLSGFMGGALRAAMIAAAIATGAWAAPQMDDKAQSSATATSQGAATAATDELGLDALKAKRAAVEASEELGDSLKKAALGLLDKAIRFREKADQLGRDAEDITRRIRSAPDRLKEIKAELDRPMPSPEKVIDFVAASRLGIEELEQRVRQKVAELAEAKDALGRLDDRLKKQKGLPQKLHEDAARARGRLEAIREELKAAPPPGEPVQVTEARRASLLAERAKCEAEVDLFNQLDMGQEVLVSVLTSERDLAALEAERREAAKKAWQGLVSTRRQQEAVRAQADAMQAKLLAADLPAGVKREFDLNIEIGRELERVSREDSALMGELERRRAELMEMEKEFARAREMVGRVVVTEAMGLALQEQRESLPSAGSYRRKSAWRQEKMSEISDAQFDLERRQQDLANLDAAAAQVIGSLGALPEAQRASLMGDVQGLLKGRRDLLEKLQAEYQRYFKNLESLEFVGQELAARAMEYGEFLDEQLLWLRSAKPVGPRDLRALPAALGWAFAPGHWWQTAEDMWSSFRRGPVWWIVGLAFGCALLAGRRWARAELARSAKSVAPVRTDTFMLTFRALAATLCLAAGWPFLMALVGWQLSSLPFAADFTRAVGGGLLLPALHLAMIGFLYHLCREDGLAEVHFRWPEPVLGTIRRNLIWFLPAALPLVFLGNMTEIADNPEYGDSLGRLVAMAIMVILAVFVSRVFRLSGGVVSTLVERKPDGWPAKLRFIWYPLAVGAPLFLAALSAFGYVYTALVLLRRLYATSCLVIFLILASELALRWLFVAKRRLASFKARRKREAGRVAAREKHLKGQTDEADLDGGPMVIEEPEVGFNQIDEQTRKLLRALIMVCAMLGLWTIWDPVLPALSLIGNVKLWSHSAVVEGVPKALPVTLSDLLVAMAVAAITIVGARNLPGVLEITLVRQVAMDPGARYAFTTIFRYAIFAIGVLVAFKTIGFSWSSVQWLIAALGVGLGFGLQEIVANFVCGLIVLFERPYRLGDVVTIGDVTGTVSRIRIRATTITDWDRHELIVPNKEFITGKLINWSLSDPITRLVVPVGIAYGSDTALAEELLMKVAKENPRVLDQPEPSALFLGFGDNSLNLELRVFVGGIKDFLPVKHQLHSAIDREFRRADITIAFPQRDVHLDTSGPLDVRVVSDRDLSDQSTPKPALADGDTS